MGIQYSHRLWIRKAVVGVLRNGIEQYGGQGSMYGNIKNEKILTSPAQTNPNARVAF